jgi:uncharacterized damage-inducible protein DinB
MPAERSALLQHMINLAHANRLANRRLHAATAGLTDTEFKAKRVSFFPSLHATLNHILIVDWYYVGALYREPDIVRAWDSETPCDTMTELADAQRVSDERLIAWCNAADDAALEATIDMDRGDHIQRDLARHVLMHLFTHQIHHRGQAHAMLAGTAVRPPQLDEFVMPTDARFRADDLAQLGWTEDDLYGRPA